MSLVSWMMDIILKNRQPDHEVITSGVPLAIKEMDDSKDDPALITARQRYEEWFPNRWNNVRELLAEPSSLENKKVSKFRKRKIIEA